MAAIVVSWRRCDKVVWMNTGLQHRASVYPSSMLPPSQSQMYYVELGPARGTCMEISPFRGVDPDHLTMSRMSTALSCILSILHRLHNRTLRPPRLGSR